MTMTDTPIFTPPEPISQNDSSYTYSVSALFTHFNQVGAIAAAKLDDLERHTESGRYSKEWARLQCVAAYAVKSGRILSALGATGCREIVTEKPIESGAAFVKQKFSEFSLVN